MSELNEIKSNKGFCEVLFRKHEDVVSYDLEDIKELNEDDYQVVGSILPLPEITVPYDIYEMALNPMFTKSRKIREYDMINILFPRVGVVSYIIVDVVNKKSPLLKRNIVIEHVKGFNHGMYRLPPKSKPFEFQSFK